MTFTDWNGQEIGVGSTVLYAAGEGVMKYAKVLSISHKNRDVRENYWDTPSGKYEPGLRGRFKSRVVVEVALLVRVEPLPGPWKAKYSSHTIDSVLHPYAFASLTKFEAPIL